MNQMCIEMWVRSVFSDVIGRAKTGRHVLFDYGLPDPPVR